LQHHLKVCCEKGGHHGRQALIIDKECTTEMCFLDEWTWPMTTSMYRVLYQVLLCHSIQDSFSLTHSKVFEL